MSTGTCHRELSWERVHSAQPLRLCKTACDACRTDPEASGVGLSPRARPTKDNEGTSPSLTPHHSARGTGECRGRFRANRLEVWNAERPTPTSWVDTGPSGDPPQNSHRPLLTNGLLTTRHGNQKGQNSIRSDACSPSLLLKSYPPFLADGLFSAALPELPCGVVSKQPSSLFSLR